MAVCQNGWPVVHDRSQIDYSVVPGSQVRIGFRKGMVNSVLKSFCSEWNRSVENLTEYAKGDEWGWYVRPVKGQSSGYSNHSGGYAADLNATQHPLGTSPSANFSRGQIVQIRRLLKKYPGVRWGGDYNGRKDGMHVEWVGSKANLVAVYAKSKARRAVKPLPKHPINGDGKVTINGKHYPDIGYLYPSSVNDAREKGHVSRSVFRVQVWLRHLDYWPKDGVHTLNGKWDQDLQEAYDKFRWDHRAALRITARGDASGRAGYLSLSLLRKLNRTKNYPIKREK